MKIHPSQIFLRLAIAANWMLAAISPVAAGIFNFPRGYTLFFSAAWRERLRCFEGFVAAMGRQTFSSAGSEIARADFIGFAAPRISGKLARLRRNLCAVSPRGAGMDESPCRRLNFKKAVFAVARLFSRKAPSPAIWGVTPPRGHSARFTGCAT